MLRYLKYIFLIFSLLAIGVGCFFFINNKTDVLTAFNNREQLSYNGVAKNCPEAQDKYFYPCFKKNLENYLEKVSLTGVSIGLKFAFNFMEQDKLGTTHFQDQKLRDLHYSVNYLEVNNLAIAQSYQRYFGLDFVYSGYISKLDDFFKSAFEFSENIIHGLRGKDGLIAVSDPQLKEDLELRLKSAQEEFEKQRSLGQDFLKIEIEKIQSRLKN